MAKNQQYHYPHGDPCAQCSFPASYHYVKHYPQGDPCTFRTLIVGAGIKGDGVCGLPAEKHPVKKHQRRDPKPYKRYYVGIDGEGQGRPHRYVMLAWSSEDGTKRDVLRPPPGKNALSTFDCLTFLCNIPRDAMIFSYAFNYDLTMMLRDISHQEPGLIYMLNRPDLRKKNPEQHNPTPVYWRGFKLNLIGTKFTVSRRTAPDPNNPTAKRKWRSTVIWDVFKFYQQKFTSAVTLWCSREVNKHTVGAVRDPDTNRYTHPDAEYDLDTQKFRVWDEPGMGAKVGHMAKMKAQRHLFDRLPDDQILAYCYEECEFMARLVRKLVSAHADAGYTLTEFFGAGSTARLLLKSLGIPEALKSWREKGAARGWGNDMAPPEMAQPIAAAFFGGRFENSVIGSVDGPIYGNDISSAYPYQLTFLPCLDPDHGEWVLTSDRRVMAAARGALVHYGFSDIVPQNLPWGPFPFRNELGEICYPAVSGGGWVWQDEFIQGEKVFPHVTFREAWVWQSHCECKPFERLPEIYLQRLKLGKEGAGIIYKLGPNAAGCAPCV